MKLTDNDLKQINDTILERLLPEKLLLLTKQLLADHKEAMDRFNQNSNNSSRPPSTTPPWLSTNQKDLTGPNNTDEDDVGRDNAPHNDHDDEHSAEDNNSGDAPTEANLSGTPLTSDEQSTTATLPPATVKPPIKRTAGKQDGAQGYGRTQKLSVTDIIYHAVSNCALCNIYLGDHATQTAWTAFCTIDIAEPVSGRIGIFLNNTKHIFFETDCTCGHHNRAEPYVAMPDVNWPKTNLTEWRLVGSRFAAMIVLLSKRYRNSRKLIREFLFVFFGIELSIGTIDQTIREAGRSAAPLEEELICELENAALAYVDETSWKEAGVLRWLWVFRTLTVVFFMVGKRDRAIFCKLLLNGRFKGIVMSDGWIVYREYVNRLRCWAHLIRKARGLSESCDDAVAKIGLEMLALFATFQEAIYTARDQPEQPHGTLKQQYESEIERLKILCENYRDSAHNKLRAFAIELLNDWDIILRQLHDPSLPLTNNEAERVLRHWVIDRRLSHGTRTPEGTRSFTILASVIETCYIRGAPIWDLLTKVIAAARTGLAPPALPMMQI